MARTTGKGVDETAVDVGEVGKDGLKATKGTVVKFDKDTKGVVVKTADGTDFRIDRQGRGRCGQGHRQRRGERRESDRVLNGGWRQESCPLSFVVARRSERAETREQL